MNSNENDVANQLDGDARSPPGRETDNNAPGPRAVSLLRTWREWQRDLQDSAVLSRSDAFDPLLFEFSGQHPPWRLLQKAKDGEQQQEATSSHYYYPDTDYLTLRRKQNTDAAEVKLQEGRDRADSADWATAQACFRQGLDLCPDHTALQQALKEANGELAQQKPAAAAAAAAAASLAELKPLSSQHQRPIGRTLIAKSAQILQDAVLERSMMGQSKLPLGADIAQRDADNLYPMLSSSSSSSSEDDEDRRRRKGRRREKKKRKRKRKRQRRRRRRDGSAHDSSSSSSFARNSDSDTKRRRKERKRKRPHSDDSETVDSHRVARKGQLDCDDRSSSHSSKSRINDRRRKRRKKRKRREDGDRLDSDNITIDSLAASRKCKSSRRIVKRNKEKGTEKGLEE